MSDSRPAAERAAVLVVDRDAAVREALGRAAAAAGFAVLQAPALEAAEQALAQAAVVVVLLPMLENEAKLGEVLRWLRGVRSDVQAVVFGKGVSARVVRDAVRAGAVDFYDAAAEAPEVLAASLRRATDRYTNEVVRRRLVQAARAITEEGLRALVMAERRELDLESTREGESPEGPYRALVVDHESPARRLLSGLLAAEGVEVRESGAAAAAIAAIERGGIEMVIAERRLPDADGLALLRDVRARAPQTEAILVVAGEAQELSTPPGDLGVAAVLGKPFDDVHDTASKIRFVVANHRRVLRAYRQLERIKERNPDFLSHLQQFRDSLARLDGA